VLRRGLLATDVPAAVLLVAAPLLLGLVPVSGVPVGPIAACLALVLGMILLAPRAVLATRLALRGLVGRAVGVPGRIAAENLPRDLPRVAVTTAALVVGVAMATSFGVFIGSFTKSILVWVDQSIPADLFITSAARFAGMKNVPMVDALREKLLEIPGVDLVERIRIADIDYKGAAVKLLSTDGEIYVQRGKTTMLEGDLAQAMAGFRRGEVMVSENFARKFGVHVGDLLELDTKRGPERFPVAGVIVDYASDLGTVFIDRAPYAEKWRDARVDTYRVYLKPGTDLETVRGIIYERYGEKFDLVVLTNREFKGEIVNLLDQVFGLMRALELVAILIAALGVVNALLASVLDRTREIGVLRAIGMRRAEVRRMIVSEAGLIGVAGTATGIAGGLALGYVLVAYFNLMQSGWQFPFRPPWLAVAETGVLVVLASALAGWYPARRGAALPVHEALEYE
jgi:putative ABC transport system permease protein